MYFRKRTHNCGELNLNFLNKVVTLNGWISRKRDLGGILFFDLRDRYGITQLKITPDKKDIYKIAEKIGHEFVISATGSVVKRENINKKITTGEIEIDVNDLEILNKSEVPPYVIEEDVKASDELRLKYRYLDMRRKKIFNNLLLRNKVYQIVHKYYEKNGFVEIETPILMKSTPEGARDFLVPSRVNKGKFYALPQSPQTFKQIIMVAGMDKYVQICKCFRDEDLRADRQPEFTQIDVEMSFVDQSDVFRNSECLLKEIWKEVLGIDIGIPFLEMTYDESFERYGTDKPDLRIRDGMTIFDISENVKDSEFRIFKDVLKKGGIVAGLKLFSSDNEGKKIEITRKIIDSLTDFVKDLGFSGLGHFKIEENGSMKSPISKFFSEEILESIKNEFSAEIGDTIFLLSGSKMDVLSALGQLRVHLAEKFNLIDESKYEFIWITDFPLFKFDEEENKFVGEHHVFTMPKDEYMKNLDSNKREDIENIRANCYDLVLNGNEIASGSIRIHKKEIQRKVFNIIGLSEEEANKKFGFLLEAFNYGAPPHGGIAFGFDRIIAILCGVKFIREVIAFPKTVSAVSLMDDSPNPVSKEQLDELGITFKKE